MPRFPRSAAASLMALALVTLSGCAATGPLDQRTVVSPAKLEEARIAADGARSSNAVVYQLTTAGAAQCTDSEPHYRAPFSLLFNNVSIKDREMRSALYAVLGVDQRPIMQAHAPSLQAYDGAEVASINGQSADNQVKVERVLERAVADNAELQLTLGDGREVRTHPITACPSLVMTSYFSPLEWPYTLGYKEATPKSWARLAQNQDEQAFLLARSIYFTAGDGGGQLSTAAFVGAAVNGVVRFATLGLSNVFGNVKNEAVRLRRRSLREDADAYAIHLMAAAGYRPAAALAFAQRSLKEGAGWPADCDELKFNQARLEALQRQL